MQDMVIKGTGNSRFLKSVENFKELFPDYDSFAAAFAAGILPEDFNGINPAGITQMGTPCSKSEVLTDDTAALFGLDKTATLNNVLRKAGKVVSGSYVGTGTNGEENPNVLEFPFAPRIVALVSLGTDSMGPDFLSLRWMVRPLEASSWYSGFNTSTTGTVSWGEDGKSVSWWVQPTGVNTSSGPSAQLNVSGKTYHYIAIG